MTGPEDGRPVVAVFRHHLLATTETFIEQQAAAMQRWSPVLVGFRPGPLAPALPHRLVRGPLGVDEMVFRLTRRSWALRNELARIRPSVALAHFAGDGWRALPTCRLAAAIRDGDGVCLPAGSQFPRACRWHFPRACRTSSVLPRQFAQASPFQQCLLL